MKETDIRDILQRVCRDIDARKALRTGRKAIVPALVGAASLGLAGCDDSDPVVEYMGPPGDRVDAGTDADSGAKTDSGHVADGGDADAGPAVEYMGPFDGGGDVDAGVSPPYMGPPEDSGPQPDYMAPAPDAGK